MALYRYVKDKRKKLKKIVSRISVFLIISGLSLLTWIIYPIASFELEYAPKFGTIIKPVPNEPIKQVIRRDVNEVLAATITDYTKASVWFPKATNIKPTTSFVSYFLSIPKLKIERATVLIGTEDLSKSLIQYTGTLPGELGNPVIFGHSTLPFLYNPKNYTTIFTKLPTLDKGDEILVSIDNVTFKYNIIDMRITSPDDLSVLEQNYDDSYITLITCVPPGTYFKRLIIKARLEHI